MKKLLLTISLAVVLVCGAMFAACNGGNKEQGEEVYEGASETFTGVVSKESYDDEKTAAEAFVENELSGQNSAAFVSCESKGELAEDKVAELNLDGVVAENDTVDSVKIMSVKYSSAAAAASGVALAAEPRVQEFVIYIIVVTPFGTSVHKYHYYVPISDKGDAITKSYFDDVLDVSKYTNFTQTYKQEAKTNVSAQGQNVEDNKVTNYQINVADNKAYIHMDGFIVESMTGEHDIYGYFEEKDGVFSSYRSADESGEYWSAFNFEGVTSMDDVIQMCLPNYDFTFYEKTAYGFKFKEEYLSQLYSETFQKLLTAYASWGVTANDIHINKSELKFYVVGGKLEKMVSDVELSINMNIDSYGYSMNINVAAASVEELVFSNFGTTTVTTPSALQAQD